MKKTALLVLSVFVASQAQAEFGVASKLNVSPRVKGIVKVAGGAASALYSLLTLKHGWTNFSASRPTAQDGNWLTWPYRFMPVPSFVMPAPNKQAQRKLSQYQFGTTGFAALLAKQLIESGLSDLNAADDAEL